VASHYMTTQDTAFDSLARELHYCSKAHISCDYCVMVEECRTLVDTGIPESGNYARMSANQVEALRAKLRGIGAQL
jgi:hypothetical protein